MEAASSCAARDTADSLTDTRASFAFLKGFRWRERPKKNPPLWTDLNLFGHFGEILVKQRDGLDAF